MILQEIEGTKVSKILKIHDYFQIYFEGNVVFKIYTRFTYKGHSTGIEALVGATLERVSGTEEEILLTFSGNSQILIDLRKETYEGPEALGLYRPGKPIVVWNEAGA